MRTHLVDATRASDGKAVYIKRVKTGDQESTILNMLNSKEYREDARNHSVPALEHFTDAEDPNISYAVMPFLREPDDPEFATVTEVLDFVDQLLEVFSLPFLHTLIHRLLLRDLSLCTRKVSRTGIVLCRIS